MIIGIGSDILDIRRIEKAVQKHPLRFAERLLSSKEFQQWQDLAAHKRVNFLAKRWAAKEAFAKACGTGVRAPVLLPNITLTRDKLGKPLIETHHALALWMKAQQINHVHISLSDDKPYCVAFVVLER